MSYVDAHNHLQDSSLAAYRAGSLPELERLGLKRAVVNGTCEEDWDAVAALAAQHAWVQPSFGLHPWHVAGRSPGWLAGLRNRLIAHPTAGVGEIGLDRWMEGHDDVAQAEVFSAQLGLAAEMNRPVTIHCLRAWGALAETLRATPRPDCGFLIHAYGGSLEMMHELVLLGGYFSFNAYFLHERKAAPREVFARIPAERLLVETDAPSMLPPEEFNADPLRDSSGEMVNSPRNIVVAYRELARIRGVDEAELRELVRGNFARIFGDA